MSLIRLDASAPIAAIKKKLVMKARPTPRDDGSLLTPCLRCGATLQVGVEATAMRVFYEEKEVVGGTLVSELLVLCRP